jgi:hypothetical protein
MRLACSLAIVALCSAGVVSQGTRSRPLVSEAQYEAWQTQLSNWGRWGPDDQLGTLNLITPAKAQAALALGQGRRAGVALDKYLFQERGGRPVPGRMGDADRDGHGRHRSRGVSLHPRRIRQRTSTRSRTTFFRGKMWNGYDATKLVTKEKGAEKNSILPMKTGIVTRAVLYDIARLKGVPYLAPGDRHLS